MAQGEGTEEESEEERGKEGGVGECDDEERSELPTPPQPLNNPELIKRQNAKQYFRRIRIANLPRNPSPKLPITPKMRHYQDRKIISCIRHRRQQRANYEAKDEELGDGRMREARGDHTRCFDCVDVVVRWGEAAVRMVCGEELFWNGEHLRGGGGCLAEPVRGVCARLVNGSGAELGGGRCHGCDWMVSRGGVPDLGCLCSPSRCLCSGGCITFQLQM